MAVSVNRAPFLVGIYLQGKFRVGYMRYMAVCYLGSFKREFRLL